MDYDQVAPDAFGRSLKGVGVNLLTKDVLEEVTFLKECLGFEAFQVSQDFAIVRGCGSIFMLHHDNTYQGHAIISMLPETPPRGGGVELRAYGVDPDAATLRAEAAGAIVLAEPADRPHGLREAFIASPSGYVWSPSVES